MSVQFKSFLHSEKKYERLVKRYIESVEAGKTEDALFYENELRSLDKKFAVEGES